MTNKRRTAIGLSGAVALLAMGAIVGAQGPGPHGGFRGRGPGGPGGWGGDGVPPIPNEPFSGTEVHSFSETLPGGNAINRSSCANVYRSSTGATRVEETRNSATCSSTPSSITITDPVAGVRYEINPAKSTYFEMKLPPRGSVLELEITMCKSGEYQRVVVTVIACALPSLPAGTVKVI